MKFQSWRSGHGAPCGRRSIDDLAVQACSPLSPRQQMLEKHAAQLLENLHCGKTRPGNLYPAQVDALRVARISPS